MRPLVTCLPFGPYVLVLVLVLPVFVCLGVSLSCDLCCAREEGECFVGDCAAGSPRLFLCIFKHINILWDPLYFKVIVLHLIMQRQEVKGMATRAPHLEVDEKRLWHNVDVKPLRVSDFPYPRILDGGKDELHSLLPRRLVGAAVGALDFVRRFHARADNGSGIVTYRRVVGVKSCGFGKHHAIVLCIHCHRPNDADEVVCVSRFVAWDLEEERRHDLPDSCEVGF